MYLVCPAIEDVPDGGLNAVKTYYEDIAKALLPDRRVGLMHGKLKPKEKAAVMEDFKAGRLDALVSTTVIEVGVDVPNASVMVIENAERYGLSALHQLRGRVGRGAAESWCFLVSDNTSEAVQKRLKFLCSTTDGFAVAQYDLETRGPGDFFGSRQHGLPTLQIADLMNDTRTLHAAQSEATALLAADPLLKNKDLSFIRNYAAGGDSLSLGAEQTVNRFLKAHGVEYPLAKGYGMTEVSSAATIAAGNVTKPGSVGIPMVNTVVSIFEPGTETELPIGQRGEICICTPTAMKGYYNKPEETAYLLRRHADGQLWAHTGDIGSMDEDGFVYLDARIKRIIIRHDGFKVFPSMIENVISRHPAVHQCCVVGCADTDHTQGRLPFVFVVLEPAATGKKRQILRELRQLCLEELPEYVQPAASAYKIIPEMPMTPAGKADYRKLEEEVG